MTKRILKSILLVSVIVLTVSSALTMGILYNYFGKQLVKELRKEAAYLAISVEKKGWRRLSPFPMRQSV